MVLAMATTTTTTPAATAKTTPAATVYPPPTGTVAMLVRCARTSMRMWALQWKAAHADTTQATTATTALLQATRNRDLAYYWSTRGAPVPATAVQTSALASKLKQAT